LAQYFAVLLSNRIGVSGPSQLIKGLEDSKAELKQIAKDLENLKETQTNFVTDILKDLSKLEEAEAKLLERVGGEVALAKNEEK
jgi:3-deoxy-D-manno-octulosonate 8-phosphate phosphatase KdsC-like HAD superfamily phosphatase